MTRIKNGFSGEIKNNILKKYVCTFHIYYLLQSKSRKKKTISKNIAQFSILKTSLTIFKKKYDMRDYATNQ